MTRPNRPITATVLAVVLSCIVVTSMFAATPVAADATGTATAEVSDGRQQIEPQTAQGNNTTAPTGTAATEPNDDFATATPLEPGSYDDLRIAENDVDVYAVDLAAGESISASIAFSHAEGDLDFYLLGPNRTIQQASESATDGENVSAIAGESGTYYLAVVGFQGATADYSLTLATSGGTDAPAPGEREPNDDFANASQIEPGTYEGLNITPGDVDIYAVDLERGEALSAGIDFEHAQGDLDLFLLGPNQSLLQVSDSTTDGENVSLVAGEAGTYYIAVAGYQSASAPYSLTVTTANGTPANGGTPATGVDTFEPNDDFANASQIEPGTYEGLNITSNDVDFFAVDVERGEALSAAIEFTHARGDLDLFLLGPDGTVLGVSNSETDDEAVSYVATETDTYYLAVIGYGGATGPYNLSLARSGDGEAPDPDNTTVPDNRTVPAPAGELEPNDDLTNATPISPGNYTGLSITPDDVDFYALALETGQSLSATISFSNAVGDLDLFVVGPNGTVRQVSASTNDTESVFDIADQQGTYYLAVAGFQGASGPYSLSIDVTTPTPADPDTDKGQPSAPPPDPETDVVGWENGYWANETIDVDQSDGLSADEREALLNRGMARVEEIRAEEFQRQVQFEVLSRDAYASAVGTNPLDRLLSGPYYNQVYEASFIVDEPTDAYSEVVGEGGTTTAAFYIPGTDRFFVVTPDPQRPVVNEGILVHELTHALQDQLGFSTFDPDATADERAAGLGLTEGEANYVMDRYESRCRNGTWQCFPGPPSGANASEFNVGVYLVGYQPYSDGPALVAQLYQEGGWDAVEAAYDDPPVSTEQTIHPERYPDEVPVKITFQPDADGEWQRFGTETLGEAWIYTMFWYQVSRYDIPVIDRQQLLNPDAGPFDGYNYTSAPSEGWGNDRVYLYTNGTTEGYVWRTVWDSEADAREFADSYEQVLEGHGGQSVGPSTWRIPEGTPYADAFRVVRNGTAVTIVNGPDEGSLAEIAPGIAGANKTTMPG